MFQNKDEEWEKAPWVIEAECNYCSIQRPCISAVDPQDLGVADIDYEDLIFDIWCKTCYCNRKADI